MGPDSTLFAQKAEAPSPQNTHGTPKGTSERRGCAGGRKYGLGFSQDQICSPSELERTSEARGLLDKAFPPHNIMLYRDPSLWRCRVTFRGP